MKRTLLLIVFLAVMLGMFTSLCAQTVTIGTGTANTSYFPIWGYYGYNYSQQIYLQSQINTSGNILSIKFWYTSGTITNSKDWVIYMGHTTQTTFDTTTSWIPLSSLTQVFAGDVSSIMTGAAGWKEIVLTTPFNYNNTDNLVIAVDENTPGYASMSWGGFTSGTNTGISYNNDYTNPNPASPPTASYRSETINRIQLVFPAVTPPLHAVNPNPADGAINVSKTPTLSWENGGEATSYDVYFGSSSNPPLIGNQAGTAYQPGNLNYSAQYYWKVDARNANGVASDVSPASVWSFTVMNDPTIVDFPHTQSFDATAFPPAGWLSEIGSGASGWQRSEGSSNPTLTPYAGAGMLFYNSFSLSALANATLISPPISAGSSSHLYTASFWMYRDGSGYPTTLDKVEVYTNSSPSLTGATLLGTVHRSYTQVPAEAAEGWYQYTFEMGMGRRDTKYFLLKAISAWGNNMNVDEITFNMVEGGTPPNPAVSPYPANNATLVAINTYLSWSSGGGAPTGYTLYLGQDLENLEVIPIMGLASYTPATNLEFGKTYYWKVDPFNDNGNASDSAELPVWQFSTVAGIATTPVPANNATGWDASNSLLNWADVANATGYKVYVGSSTGNYDMVGGLEVFNSDYDYPTYWPYSTDIFWKVNTMNGTQEVQGTEWKFTTSADPTLYPPFMQDFSGTTFPPANWTRWSGALEDSSVLTSTTSGFARKLYGNTGSNYGAAMNIYSGGKYWLMTPRINLGQTKTSYVFECDVLLTQWNGTGSGTMDADDYAAILVSTDGSWSTSNVVKFWNQANPLTSEHVSVDLSSYNGLIYIAFYGGSNTQTTDLDFFLDNIQVTAAGAPPTAPTTFTPASGATNVAVNTNLSWAGATGNPAGYKVYFGLEEDNLEQIGNVASSPLALLSPLQFAKTYYWYVQAYSDNGEADGPTISFTTANGKATTPVPANNATNYSNLSTTLNWDDVAGATGYKIKVGTTSGASDIADMVDCATSDWTAPIAWTYNQQYYWTVYTLNGSQEVQGDEWTFTVGSDPTVTAYPWIENFDSVTEPTIPTGWAVINANNDTNLWYSQTSTSQSAPNAMYINYNGSMPSDDWLVSPPMVLSAGRNYILSFYYRARLAYYPENMRVMLGGAPTAEALGVELWSSVEFNNTTFALVSQEFTVPTSGTYFLGWHAFSEADMFGIYLDNVKVEIPTVTVPGDDAVVGGDIPPELPGTDTGIPALVYTVTSTGVKDVVVMNPGWGVDWYCWLKVGNTFYSAANPIPAATTSWTFPGINFDTKGSGTVIINDNQTLPVELSSFTATLTADMFVSIAWVSASETNHMGYNILRGESTNVSSALKINNGIIDEGTALGTQTSYSYADAEVDAGVTYYYWLESVDLGGMSTLYGPLSVLVTGDPNDPGTPELPTATRLMNAFPNPFNPNTTLRYSLKEAGKVRIEIYNLKGQMVRSYNNEHATPGYYQVSWDGTDANGRKVSSGVYMYRMVSGGYHSTKKMVLAK